MSPGSNVGKEEKAYNDAIAKDKAKQAERARKAKEKEETKKAKNPGDNYGQNKLNRGRAEDNRGPRMSPGDLQRAIDRGAEKTRESVGRVLPQPQQGRTASA